MIKKVTLCKEAYSLIFHYLTDLSIGLFKKMEGLAYLFHIYLKFKRLYAKIIIYV